MEAAFNQVYVEALIDKIETLFGRFTLVNGRAPFTIYRDELIAMRKNELNERKEKGEMVDEIQLTNTENRNLFGENNTNDKELWKSLDPEIKEAYTKKSKREKKMFRIEYFLIKTLLFFSYNPLAKKFRLGPQEIYKVEKFVVYFQLLYYSTRGFNI